jgi:hypothetical protein
VAELAGLDMSLPLRADDAQALHDHLEGHGMRTLIDLFNTPVRRTPSVPRRLRGGRAQRRTRADSPG